MARRVIRPSHQRESFLLDLTRNVSWKQLPNRGLFAVFADPRSPSEFNPPLFLARGTLQLRRRLRQYRKSLPHLSRVYVETAASQADFTDPQYQRLLAGLFWGIAEIKRLGDQLTLRALRAALARKDRNPGPQRRQDTNHWKLQTLRDLASGKQLKASLHHPRRTASSTSAELGRFCRDFYWWCACLDAHSPQSWQQPRPSRILGRQFGFVFPQDASAAAEAYRRGQKSFALSLRDYTRFQPPLPAAPRPARRPSAPPPRN